MTIQETLQSSTSLLSLSETIGRFANIIASSVSGCAGGLLLPSLTIGAGIGSVFSMLAQLEDGRIFVTAGMAASLGSLIKAPLTAAVLVIELTGQTTLIFPILFCSLIAATTLKKLA